jgi:oxalate decarboxylase
MPNLKLSFSAAHNRLEDRGGAREVSMRELPASKSMALTPPDLVRGHLNLKMPP